MAGIRVLDFETTGIEPPAEVCEVGFCDVTTESRGDWRIGAPVARLCRVQAMPPEVRAIHHISLAECEPFPPFDANGFVSDLGGCSVIASHNAEFEAQWLPKGGAIPLLCTYKAALRVWPEAPGHSNSVLRYWLEDQGLIELNHDKAMPPHRAGPDAYVTAHILRALLGQVTARQMVAWTQEPKLLPTCPIGAEWRGKPWAVVDAGFLRWMLNNATMESDLKWNAQRELDRRASK
jgi:exodeoxyribonuclease X